MDDVADIHAELLGFSNRLINCSARNSQRIEQLLDGLRALGIAERLWLLTTGFGLEANDANKTWQSKGAARLDADLSNEIRLVANPGRCHEIPPQSHRR